MVKILRKDKGHAAENFWYTLRYGAVCFIVGMGGVQVIVAVAKLFGN